MWRKPTPSPPAALTQVTLDVTWPGSVALLAPLPLGPHVVPSYSVSLEGISDQSRSFKTNVPVLPSSGVGPCQGHCCGVGSPNAIDVSWGVFYKYWVLRFIL